MEWRNYHHLRYFWTVAKEGSLARAAATLHVSQPSISEQIRELESALGEKLFRREGRGFIAVPTVALDEAVKRYGFRVIGPAKGCRVRLHHPAATIITAHAKAVTGAG